MPFIDTIFRLISERKPKNVTFSILLPDTTQKTFGSGKPSFTIVIKSTSVYTSAITKGFLGIGEDYMLGNIEILGDLDLAFITLMTIFSQGNKLKGHLGFQFLDATKRLVFPETKAKALKDVGAHYDLSNDFFKAMLDPTMTYSCAYFKKDSDSLEKAQLQKYEHVCRKLQLKKGETLLDVGCGWGGMLIYAAKNYGIKGCGVTLSKNQYSYVTQQISEQKLGKVLKVELKDYRDVQGTFDKFVSIAMFEQVTEKFFGDFFAMIKRTLKPGGVGFLHTIGNNDVVGQHIDPWLETYIFPGTYIPSATELLKYSALHELYPQDLENLRLHYALTLKAWIKNYEQAYQKTLGERGEKFARMWRLYLYACRASFVVGTSQLWQLTFTHDVTNSFPLTRGHIYT